MPATIGTLRCRRWSAHSPVRSVWYTMTYNRRLIDILARTPYLAAARTCASSYEAAGGIHRCQQQHCPQR